MRIVFCGTAEFAVPSLQACCREHEVVAVVTQPDKSGSRGRPAPRPVADAAREASIPIFQPPRLREPEAQNRVLAYGADAMVVAAFGQIIPESLLYAHRCGGINVHASLLPRWRGASPVAAAILAGDESTGISIMKMEAGLDTGPVYLQQALAIGAQETAVELERRLAVLGAELLLPTLRSIAAGTARFENQDPGRATYASRLRREDGVVDWSGMTAVEIDRRVRALQPWPGANALLDEHWVRLCAGQALEGTRGEIPGTILGVHGDAVDVAASAGIYRIFEVQPPSKRPMSAAAYLRGRRH